MGKGPHYFKEFFTLIDPPKKTANKRTVCNFCIKEYTFSVASLKIGCFVSNKAKLCQGHLIKCENFNNQVSESERIEILARYTESEEEEEEEEEKKDEDVVKPSKPPITTQSLSNGLPFTFFENEETKEIFNFIAPALKLPSRKRMSDRILLHATKMLKQSITKSAQNDKIGVTVACDGWTNIKQEHLFGVVFITSTEAEKNKITINCFVSDSAGEYAAARRIMRIEYPNKDFLSCMAHQMNLIIGEIFKASDIYQQTSTKAVKIVSYFHSSAYFMGLLRNEHKSLYGKTTALATPGET
ncbi:hypothetical protein RclHR1_00430029 [Rhizophagus clarus]|uniref:DUF659 domain-containing protein n=1 Tax=Rhizophagus clarus TaxID=94130 RepID=A0A2Z6RYY8_9GLOM|nr:hypothetical protein RclHR1_00430029 [Rhizophagus clarus]